MENLKNQFGHHVVITRDGDGQITDLQSVYVMTATEYRDALDSLAIYRQHQLQERTEAQQQADEERSKNDIMTAAEAKKAAFNSRYSREHLVLVWNTLKIMSFEGKTTVTGEELDELFASSLDAAPGDEIRQVIERCPEFTAMFEALIRDDQV